MSRRFEQVVSRIEVNIFGRRPINRLKEVLADAALIQNPYDAISEDEELRAAFRLTIATRRDHKEEADQV